MLEEIDLSKNALKKFGKTMCLCLCGIGLVFFIKHKPAFRIWWFLGFFLLLSAQIMPFVLKPIYKFWMRLAFCLGWFNTRLILIAVYYLVVTPIGLVARLFGKDFLNVKLDRSLKTYWQQRETAGIPKERYERIF